MEEKEREQFSFSFSAHSPSFKETEGGLCVLPQQSIDIACPRGAQQQTRRTPRLRRMMGQTYRRTDTRSNSAVDRGGRSVCQSNDKRRKYCQHCPTTQTDDGRQSVATNDSASISVELS